jgi:sortase (surface protein transpeptidase)
MPERYDITAWYTGSPTPGELGPAIIAGHVDSFKGTGIFFRLRELQPGDTVSVSRVDGTTATFKITSLEQYPKNSFPTQKVYGNITYAGIRLITCGGAFDSQTYEYTDNIVAYGELQ